MKSVACDASTRAVGERPGERVSSSASPLLPYELSHAAGRHLEHAMLGSSV
jgi:hypothetical protein